ncbi:MAG: phenylalanine--tRNA ligase subunit beta [Candidatus Acidiferrales bacterium]
MRVLYDWLAEFVAFAATPEELRERLSLSGTAVDAIEKGVGGTVLDVEVTANRGDCLGHYGLAREVSAVFRLPLRAVAPKLKETTEKASSAVRVEIDCPELCGRYTARVLRGVKIGPSPARVQERLEALGQTSINNVVDATNLVMFELGHPLHAFDLDTIDERRIVVRRARAGERMRTLDGQERKLTPEMCMIADANRAVAIGGVMGGAKTEISSTTRTLLLECAWFDPVSIRRTSKALGLRTEASQRFERGADPEMAELASRRCAELIQQLAGGDVLAGVVDVYPGKAEAPRIELTRKELLRVLGADVPDAEIEAILKALGFGPVRTDSARGSVGSLMATWECRRPSWRADVSRGIDLVEEVARHFGLEKFPSRLPPAKCPAAQRAHADAEERLRELLVGLGYREIISITHVDADRDALFRAEGATPVRIANPIAEDAPLLRSSGAVSMATALEWNLNHGQRNLRLFEIGRRYAWAGAETIETRVLTIGASGLTREQGIAESPRAYGFEDLKGDLDQFRILAGDLRWTAGGPAWLQLARAATFALADGTSLGCAGLLSRRVAERFKLRQDAYLAELDLDPLYAAYRVRRASPHYQPLPRFPAVERDFSLFLPDGVAFTQVAQAIQSLGIEEIASVEALDLFHGKGVPERHYSLLVRVTFQSYKATLTDAQLTDASGRIVRALEPLGAKLRAS